MATDSSLSQEDRLLVFVRLKPMKNNDKASKIFRVMSNKSIISDDNIQHSKKHVQKPYMFDHVFDENVSQEKIYEISTAHLIKDVLYGFNAAVFAYGATGTGKTYTMLGNDNQPGIMVQALCDLVNQIRASDNPGEYKTSVSYLEIYNEQIRDLLNPSSGFLDLREDAKGKHVRVNGLSETTIATKPEVNLFGGKSHIMKILHKGNKERTIEPTVLNETSSRSHAILMVNITYTNTVKNQNRNSRFLMIDLAGSEKGDKSLSKRDKKVQIEGSHINKSLLALGNCINAISIGARYVNFRDSKLTRLLKGTLSGNCKTVMIAHISQAVDFKDESRTTLCYAERANFIRKKVERNSYETTYHLEQYQDIIKDLRGEIDRLKVRIHNSNKDRDTVVKKDKIDEINFRGQVIDTFEEHLKLRKKLTEINSNVLGLNIDAERLHLLIAKWEARNNRVYGSQDVRLGSQSSLLTNQSFDDCDVVNNEFDEYENVQSMWSQLADIDNELDKLQQLRHIVSEKLELCKTKSEQLESEIKSTLTSVEQKELLKLLCRVYELEADKISLKSDNLIRVHELRRNNLSIFYLEHQRQICEEVVSKQRELLERNKIELNNELQNLYKFYQQEIQESIYADANLNSNSILTKVFGDRNFRQTNHGSASSDELDDELNAKLKSKSHSNIDWVMGPVVTCRNTKIGRLF